MGEFRSISGKVAREGQFSMITETASVYSKVFGWSMSQREGTFDSFCHFRITPLGAFNILFQWK